MNDLEEKIDKIQKDFDNEFAKIFDKDNPSNKDLSYTNLIIPYVKKIEKILPENSIEWPLIVSNKYTVNIYYEFLYYKVLYIFPGNLIYRKTVRFLHHIL